jgi:hypothetical protein
MNLYLLLVLLGVHGTLVGAWSIFPSTDQAAPDERAKAGGSATTPFSKTPRHAKKPPTAAAAAGPLPGLFAQFWNNVTFAEFAHESYLGRVTEEPEQTGGVATPLVGAPDVAVVVPNLDWTMRKGERYAQFPGVVAEKFVAVVSGFLTPPTTGTYRFDSEVNAVLVLTINGALCYDSVSGLAACALELEAGRPVSLLAKFYADDGGAVLGLRWRVPVAAGQSEMEAGIVPATMFTHATNSDGSGGGDAGRGSEL